jgi:hypothetical protein
VKAEPEKLIEVTAVTTLTLLSKISIAPAEGAGIENPN